MKLITKIIGLMLVMAISTIAFGQRTVGQIEASDPDPGQILTFSKLAERPNEGAFDVTPDGELYVADEVALVSGEWEVDVRVTDDGEPPLSSDATMFITVFSSEGDSTVVDSVWFPQYEKYIVNPIQIIDSTWIIDSTQIWVDASYWQYDTIQSSDTTTIIYTPVEAIYNTDTIPSNPEL